MSTKSSYSQHKAGITQRMAAWWEAAESAADAQQLPRARRYLRWILAADPHDEEAWLLLARLASDPNEEMAYLQQAYAFHPNSYRTVAALREARAQQLQTAVPDLSPRTLTARCLPNRQRNGHAQPRSQSGSEDNGSRVMKAPSGAGLRALLNLL
jgi:hypothetical protein